MSAEFRKYLPDLTTERWAGIGQRSASGHAEHLYNSNPLVRKLENEWRQLYNEPFRGISSDGNVIPNLYTPRDDGIDIHSIVEATKTLLKCTTPEESNKLLHPISAPEWRAWSNPEIYMNPFGLRLDEVSGFVALAILAILKATLSPEGYTKAISEMRINHFLGEIVGAPGILNKYSYNFLLFGEPSDTEVWGWSLFGHHLCLNVLFYGKQIVISPTFTGAEPNEIDDGEYAGTRILHSEERLGLQFMQSLDLGLQEKAQVYKSMHDEAMPEGRWNLADQRHLCGAFQDNRIVPYEGICLSGMGEEKVRLLLQIIEQFVLYLPLSARQNRLQEVKKHVGETWFCWIGGYGDSDAFYYRIQSPVIIVEFDHHSGVFLHNEEPAKFHIHTLVRTPNGGDYGFALRDCTGGGKF